MNTMQRDKRIDLIKGIGIILVVGAHAGVPHSAMISMFHMAIFFIASGYCYKDQHSNSLKELGVFVVKKVKTLYLPFVLWNVFFLAIRDILLWLNIYTNDGAFLDNIPGNSYGLITHLSKNEFVASLKEIVKFQGEQQLEGASWFLRALFSASIFFAFWDFLLKKIISKYISEARIISAVAFLMIGNEIGQKNIILRLNLHGIFAIYFLFVLGLYLKQWKILMHRMDWRFNVLLLSFSLMVLRALEGLVSVNLNDSVFSSIQLFVLVSILGWLLLWSMATIISKGRKITGVIQYIGKHSMSILMMHFVCFKVITYLQVKLYSYPSYALAAFPCLNNTDAWCYAYVIAGVVLPILVNYIFIQLKDKSYNYIVRKKKW